MTEEKVKKPRAPRKKKVEEVVEAPEQPTDNVRLSIEQILAAVVDHFGKVDIPMQDLVKDFTGKQISVSQDGDLVSFQVVEEGANG